MEKAMALAAMLRNEPWMTGRPKVEERRGFIVLTLPTRRRPRVFSWRQSDFDKLTLGILVRFVKRVAERYKW